MDHELFRKRLAEFAELKAARPPRNPCLREASEPEDIYRAGQEFQITKDLNPTLAVEIKKMKPVKRNCQHCGLVVTNQVIQKRLLSFPEMHWRETCSSCKMTKNPETGKFDLEEVRSKNFFVSYFHNKNK